MKRRRSLSSVCVVVVLLVSESAPRFLSGRDVCVEAAGRGSPADALLKNNISRQLEAFRRLSGAMQQQHLAFFPLPSSPLPSPFLSNPKEASSAKKRVISRSCFDE